MSRESLTHFWLRIKALVLRRRLDRDLEEELQFHLAMRERKNGSDGAPRDEARAAARRRFGNVALLKEVCREMWTFAPLETFWQDVRYTLRMLRKSPGFTAIAVITLALGISVNTTIFTVINGVILRKPPVHAPDSLMIVSSVDPSGTFNPDQSAVSTPDYHDWLAQSTSFSGMAYGEFGDVTISGAANPDYVTQGGVSANYFDVLGVGPALGRTFVAGEDQEGHDSVVVLSDAIWKSRFGSDPNILGRTLKINGNSHTVIGVMPRSFHLANFPARIWTPLVLSPKSLFGQGRGYRHLTIFARFKDGVSPGQARSEMRIIAQRIAAAHPDTNRGWGASVKTLQRYSIEDSGANVALSFLMAAVAFVLLIACANLANLLLARNTARRREFSIRSVIGAGRIRIIRQLLTESLLLSVSGGMVGIALAYGLLRIILTQLNWNEDALAMAQEIVMDRQVLAFTLAICLLAAVLFGLAPALQISRGSFAATLREGGRGSTAGRGSHRLQRLLVAGQIALSIFLLVGAGLFVEGFIEETSAKKGLNPDRILTAEVPLRGLEYLNPTRQKQFTESILRRLQNLPGGSSAAVATDLPYNFPGDVHFTLAGHPPAQPSDRPHCGYFAISPGYFSTFQIPLLQGRELTNSDTADSPQVVIVNEAFARQYFPHDDPVGHQLVVGQDASAAPKPSQIVGVVGNFDEFLGQVKPRPELFVPLDDNPSSVIWLAVRTDGAPLNFADSLRGAVWAIDSNQAITEVRTMDRVITDSSTGDNLLSELMGSFAAIALALAAIGIYGVLSYLVGQRTHEMGIRMALGARPGEVLRLVVRHGMTLVGSGVAIGFLLSLALPKLVAAEFQEFYFRSGWVLILAPPIVLLVGLAACWVPARRAMRVDPMVALRYE